MIDTTRAYINEISKKEGFQKDTLEKEIRLYYVLREMAQRPLFKDNLALKGGTAINLAYFDLPRLSIDIDMDLTKSGKMIDLQPLRKEIKDTLFDLLQSQGYTLGQFGKEIHTLDQWTFDYTSISGNNDHIKVELNYGIRNHVLPITDKHIKLNIVSDPGIHISTLHPCELFATKINALIERAAIRDLFDVYLLAKSDMLSTTEKKELLRKSIIFYQTIGVEGSPKSNIDLSKIMHIPPSKIKSQLIPLLPSGKKFFPIDMAKDEVSKYLSSILTLSPKEQEYLENFSKGVYMPELLFSDREIIKRIIDHPMAIWKIERINRNLSTPAPKDDEFNKALRNKDFCKLSYLRDNGYSPSPKIIEELKGSVPEPTLIAIRRIFDLPMDLPGENIRLVRKDHPKIENDKNNDLKI